MNEIHFRCHHFHVNSYYDIIFILLFVGIIITIIIIDVIILFYFKKLAVMRATYERTLEILLSQ